MHRNHAKKKKANKKNSNSSAKIPSPPVNTSMDELTQKNRERNYRRWIMFNQYLDKSSKNHDEANKTTNENLNTTSKNPNLSANKSIERLIEKLKESYYQRWTVYYQRIKGNGAKNETKNTPGITVITSTIRPEYMNAVFENYNRQTYEAKEFIIVLNKNSMDIKQWKEKAKHYPNVRVFQLDEKVSFGKCYNFCVAQSKYDYIAPFDDDDYYAPHYLRDIVEAFKVSNADVVGKKTRYVYFENSSILAISNINNENRYVEHIDGPTLSFNKKVFDKVQFTSLPVGIDGQFCKDCVANGIKIYSTNKFNHVYIRHSSSHKHTWKISDDKFLCWCVIIGEIKNYQEYVAR